MRRRFVGALLGLTFAGAVLGCSSEEAPSDDNAAGGAGAGELSQVEMFSWWTGPGEAEALQALLDVHLSRYPNARVFNAAAASGADAQGLLVERLDAGEPPDLFQENAHQIPEFLVENPDSLVALDSLFEQEGWNRTMLPEVLEEIRIDGEILSMPVGLHRENALFFNKEIFKTLDLEPPETMEEFFAVCEELKQAGVNPIATGYQNWILRIMFHSITMGTMGGDAFIEFYEGRGDLQDPDFIQSLANFRRVLEDYVPDDMKQGDFGWQDASQSLIDGDAAMFFHGDWVGGYVQQLGWTAGIDYGVVSAPGASDVFLFGVDVFAVPVGAENEAGAFDFFRTIGSLEGQAAFNNNKGSTPVRLDADSSKLTAVGKAALEELKSAKHVEKTPSLDGLDDAILKYAEDLNEDEFVAFFEGGLYAP